MFCGDVRFACEGQLAQTSSLTPFPQQNADRFYVGSHFPTITRRRGNFHYLRGNWWLTARRGLFYGAASTKPMTALKRPSGPNTAMSVPLKYSGVSGVPPVSQLKRTYSLCVSMPLASENRYPGYGAAALAIMAEMFS